jgi:hypothetical protein
MLTHDERAQMNRPTDPTQLGMEIRRLSKEGLTPRDISVALRLALPVVLEALQREVIR